MHANSRNMMLSSAACAENQSKIERKKKYASVFSFCQHEPKSKKISFTQVSSDWPATDNNQQELNKLVITGWDAQLMTPPADELLIIPRDDISFSDSSVSTCVGRPRVRLHSFRLHRWIHQPETIASLRRRTSGHPSETLLNFMMHDFILSKFSSIQTSANEKHVHCACLSSYSEAVEVMAGVGQGKVGCCETSVRVQ